MNSSTMTAATSSATSPRRKRLWKIVAVVTVCSAAAMLLAAVTLVSRPQPETASSHHDHRKLLEVAEETPPDATFCGFPLHLKQNENNIPTLPHCVGENYQDSSKNWMARSCHFQHLFCFDTLKQDYVVFADTAQEEQMQRHMQENPLLDVSQSYLQPNQNNQTFVSIGGINQKWNVNAADSNNNATAKMGMDRLQWFPEIRDIAELKEYYELPKHAVMIPFHSMNAANPGHLVWDDFLPIYTLLEMFQLLSRENELLLMRYILPGNDSALWASCDVSEQKKQACRDLQHKFLPLMVGSNRNYREMPTNHEYDFQVASGGNAKQQQSTNLICANHGLAGIGGLTDHGTEKLHGWEDDDYELTHNHGRGGLLYDFRNFMMSNLGF
ncbi:MAG: hypothetical protein SGARI_005768, partial [Bacillariaceae sp.]